PRCEQAITKTEGIAMNATNLRFLSVLLSAVLLGACGERLDLEVKARIDGQPAAQAKVVVDREELGVTDAQGVLAKQLRKKAGAEIDVTVSKIMPGYRIEPWKSTVLVKLPKDGQAATYRLDADLKAMRYVTFRVSEKDAQCPGPRSRSAGRRRASPMTRARSCTSIGSSRRREPSSTSPR